MSTELIDVMRQMGQAALAASDVVSLASTEAKNLALTAAAVAIREREADILAANAHDLTRARALQLSAAAAGSPRTQ